MEDKSKDSLITQTLEVPKRESKEGVFSSYLELRLAVAQVMKSDAYSVTDERANHIIDWMISGIPNRTVQEALRKELKETIEKETNNLSSNEEKGRKIQEIYRDLAGKIAPYMDSYTGGERNNRISFIIPIKEMREVMKKTNQKHFKEHFDEEIKI